MLLHDSDGDDLWHLPHATKPILSCLCPVLECYNTQIGQHRIMNIELTKEQYTTLAKTVYLGNWMANAQRTGKPGDEHVKEYDALAEFIFSLAPTFGYPKEFEHELECGDHKNTTEIVRIQEQYDNGAFRGEFCERVGKREFLAKFSKEVIGEMTDEEYLTKLQECIAPIEKEFDEYGLERVTILKWNVRQAQI